MIPGGKFTGGRRAVSQPSLNQRTRSGLNRGNGIREKRATIQLMVVAIFFLRVLEVMFFVGLAGSSVVVLISFIEDGKELFGKDEE
jgi:hypothetical protein